jgi:hypothetical protein
VKLSLAFASAVALAITLALGAAACDASSGGDRAQTLSFDAEPDSEGPVVFLRGRSEQERIHVDVVARGVSDVHGAAFRVTWDPEAIAFVEAQASGPWSSKAVLLAREPVPGQLAVAWSEKGEAAGHDASAPLVLGTLVFEAKSRKGTALAFRAARSTVVDHRGQPTRVAWRAGSIPAR